jgi:nucleolin
VLASLACSLRSCARRYDFQQLVDVVNEGAAVSESGGAAPSSESVDVYCGNLSFDATQEDLKATFSQFGEVVKVMLPFDRTSGRPRGFGFVTLASRADAAAACAALNETEFLGRTIRVNESKGKGHASATRPARAAFNEVGNPTVRLYVGNIPWGTDEAEIRDRFAAFGFIDDLYFPTEYREGQGETTKGFAFVTMPAAEAERAMADLDGFELGGRLLRVDEATRKKDRNEGGGGWREQGGGGGYGGGGGGGGYGGGDGGYY